MRFLKGPCSYESKRRNWFGIYTTSPGAVLHSATRMIEMYIPLLERLRRLADEGSPSFCSEGFTRFFKMLQHELGDDYLATLREHLKYVAFREGVLISAHLGTGLESQNHMLRKSKSFGKSWLHKVFRARIPTYSFSISARDEAGARALGELRDRGLNFAADSLARSADHIESFFKLLLAELAFYVGCVNLHEELVRLDEPVCFPLPLPAGALGNEFSGLYNVCLSLRTGQRTVAASFTDDYGYRPLLIRTEQRSDGVRTFRIVERAPSQRSHGEDFYRKVFGEEAEETELNAMVDP